MGKRRKQKHKNLPAPLIVLIAGGILLIAAAIFLFSGGSDGGGTPALAVDQRVIDYGDVKYDTPKTFAITVTNMGDGVLRFKEQPYIETLEGC